MAMETMFLLVYHVAFNYRVISRSNYKNMNIRKPFLLLFALSSSLFFQVGMAKDNPDLSTYLKADNPSGAITLAKTLDHSSAKYGDTSTDSYYSSGSPSFKLLDFTLEDCTISLFDKEIGLINVSFKGDENRDRLFNFLTESLGDGEEVYDDGDASYRWLGKDEFYYELVYADYSETYYLSISNDVYRNFKESYGG
ncbi:hypothetical protein [Granulosicoccus antarcticus]|uniref:Uncharacterized protein n=1 Tax=Granulosicoccus antarcticus IMCC3135 TaxID=1192854 RepID=A0A2Z2P0H2_9GAMM|nr:hypothetical protein [Granulosicoccus antarcticus]ASJ73687.1 hypothetical protein IMCC3135_18040 [Granulosicoccus antarcticus IMCC3135]